MPEALAVDWDEIKAAAIAGVPFIKIAEQWDIRDEAGTLSTNSIRQRSFREAWPVPRAIMERAKLQLAKAKELTKEDSSSDTEPSVTAVTVAADSLLENGQKSNLIASQIALRLLTKAADSPDAIAPLSHVSDVKTALSVARIAAGMDREGAEVKVNLAMFQAGAMPETGVSWEVETVESIGENEE